MSDEPLKVQAPVEMSRDKLADVLRDLATIVESPGSWEGRIMFSIDGVGGPVLVDVRGSYRDGRNA